MMKNSQHILFEIERFLDEVGMGSSYFGKKATGNSELVGRLRSGGRVWPETAEKIIEFITAERQKRNHRDAA